VPNDARGPFKQIESLILPAEHDSRIAQAWTTQSEKRKRRDHAADDESQRPVEVVAVLQKIRAGHRCCRGKQSWT
jgi:hypothetical protein